MLVDPRLNPEPPPIRRPPPVTRDPDELKELHALCQHGRLYDIERWIAAGRPLQIADPALIRRRRWQSAMEIALEDGSHALVLLLLANGYRTELEDCPLDLALRARRTDLVELLLDWGADPHRVDLHELFDTYDSALFTRFHALGVDLTSGHALARTLGYHTSNKPLFGWAKRHVSIPKVQAELNIALVHHASEGNEKGISLCLWAGADPHAPAPSLRWGDDEDEYGWRSAVHEACAHGDADLVRKLGPDLEKDDLQRLYRAARTRGVIHLLAALGPPPDPGKLIAGRIQRMSWPSRSWRTFDALKTLLDIGVHWQEATTDEIAGVRRTVLRLDEHDFVGLLKLLVRDDHCAPEILEELTRTPAMRRRMKEVGFIPPDNPDWRYRESRPTRSREVLKKCGIDLRSKSRARPTVPRVVQIGSGGRGRRLLRLTRQELYERVWTTPVVQLSEEWGISDRGLSKSCQRAHVPVPPRGYWAKRRAGKRVGKTRLPKLSDGEGEEVLIWGRGG